MPALIKTDFTGKITWLGHVPDRDASLLSQPVAKAFASFAGFEAEDHGGLTRASCSRVLTQYPRNTVIRNTRQFSIVSAEEMQTVADKIGVATFDPQWIGASIVISGLPDFTHLPPSSRLQMPSGATLTVDMENRPCVLPGPYIEADAPGVGKKFKAAAKDKRGVTAWVEREGDIAVGDVVTLHIPDQRVWQPAS
ncbi:MOSC domain-containing protein [Algirhabdus cladophorae]|uniref:MOSC domain-containing protein n=1 Tax=Algirhabdus cladophorae TaxID=3377108 RepID=UPI003B845CC0